MIRYHTDDEGVVSQPEYTLPKPSNGPNDRDHLTGGATALDQLPDMHFLLTGLQSTESSGL